ncbi:hypothetical protein CPB86DRAFT_805498 [Serendipita vermifera]|nr:hypothetical protein CPB86DRAFT_805498 [Serendipita vermifera]
MTKRPRLEDDSSTFDGSKPISLQRRRVWRACEECRRKKVKCDSREPVCSQCAATSATCKWTQTKDRAALSRHYVQELEARLLYMEQQFKLHAPHIDVFPKEGSGLPPNMAKNVPTLAPFPSATKPPDGANAKEDDLDVLAPVKHEDENHLTEHFGQMTLDAEGNLRWIGGSSTQTLIETFRNEIAGTEDLDGTPSSDQSDGPNMLYFPTGLGFGKLRALPSAEEVEYPERDLADSLVEAYFERFHFLLPVLDKPLFLARYNTLMDERGSGEQPGFVAVVFAVFAVAARFLDDPRIKSKNYMDPRSTAMIFYERAMMLYIIDHTRTQMAHVQCFALLSTFLASLNRLPQAWLLVGQAVRTAQDLGLHRSPKPLKLTKVEKETRRKVWWCVYGLDRCLAVQLGRPLGVDDNDIDVDLPLPFDDDELPLYYEGILPEKDTPSLMQGFVALTSLYKIAGKVLRHVYATDKLKGNISKEKAEELQKVVDRLDLQLTKWCDTLHPNLRQSPLTPQMSTMSGILCSSYYAVLITLHRNFLPTRRNMVQSAGSSSVPKAVFASRSCIFLASSMNPDIPPSHYLAVFVQSLFSSAIIILLVVMHATDRTAAEIAMSEVSSCVQALTKLERAWPGATKCRDMLVELTQITQNNMAKTDKPRAQHTPRSSVQLASPTGSSNNSLSASPNPQPQVNLPTTSATSQRLASAKLPSLNGASLQSTPSPPLTFSAPFPAKRPHEETGTLRPLMIHTTPPKTLPRHAPKSSDPDFKSERFDGPLSAGPTQQTFGAPSWRLPNPSTFLNNPRFFGNHSQEFAPSFAPTDSIRGSAATNIFFANQANAPTMWNDQEAQNSGYDSFDYPGLSGMEFMQNLVPPGQLQAEGLWDGIPEVFSAEPRIFGAMDEYLDAEMN